MSVPAKIDSVIIGGGIVGASIAYHLAEIGYTDVCLIERGQLTCGTTWHAAGLVAELRATPNLTRLAKYSAELYESLEASGEPTGFRRVGALTLATNTDRVIELKRQASMAANNGVDTHWLSPAEITDRWPHIAVDEIRGALYLPRDAQTSPVETTLALARVAKKHGIDIFEGVSVTSIETEDGVVTGVRTDDGDIQCRQIVICAGLWSRTLALSAGAILPLYAAEHFYAVTQPLDLPADAPIVREPDAGIYLKPDAGRMLVGCFEQDAKPLDSSLLADDFAFAELPFDLDHFAPYLQSAIERIPQLAELGIRTWFNGPESFTPDGRYILGALPEATGLFAACGFNSIGIQSAGGVGQVMARWLTGEYPGMDLWEVDVRRFFAFQNNEPYLVHRTSESLGLLYAMHWPHRQYESARPILQSPLHDRLASQGACFGELAGWERANWYGEPGTQPSYEYSYARQNWFEPAGFEHRAVRNDVALFDQTSFAKYQINGPDACRFLNYLCTANVDVPLNRVVYCQWLNEQGGIEADVTVTRLAADRYWVISAAPCARRDLAWLNSHRASAEVDIVDITHDYAVIGVMGPNSRALLSPHTAESFDHDQFPFATSRQLVLAGRQLRATRITYVGTLGWELYIPWDDAAAVYDVLAESSPVHAGYHAMDSLRMEKAYRHWGHDICDEDSPLEAGLGFTIDWDKPGGFSGIDALREQRKSGVKRRLGLFTLADPTPLLFHDEPIWCDGRRAGRITSGAFGHTLGASLGFGYVSSAGGGDADDDVPLTRKAMLAGRYEIEIAGEKVPAKCSMRALYDPENTFIHT